VFGVWDEFESCVEGGNYMFNVLRRVAYRHFPFEYFSVPNPVSDDDIVRQIVSEKAEGSVSLHFGCLTTEEDVQKLRKFVPGKVA
jgi:hypothetical protein